MDLPPNTANYSMPATFANENVDMHIAAGARRAVQARALAQFAADCSLAVFLAIRGHLMGSDLVFVVMKESKGNGREIWVFDNHADALRCRQEQQLDSSHLWGCAIGCYKFKDER